LLGLGGTNHGQGPVEGSAKEIKGKTKEGAGKVLGDAKLESEGNAMRRQKDPESCRRRQRHAQGN